MGLIGYLDVSVYANSKFTWKQMGQIRLGLKDNLDVSVYAKSEIPWQEMKEIRLKLLEESTL